MGFCKKTKTHMKTVEATPELLKKYPLSTEADFKKFRDTTDGKIGDWSLKHEEGKTKVWSAKSEVSPFDMIRLYTELPDIDADLLYDVLHDPDYRVQWDESMLEGLNLVRLGPNDDIGYYCAKSPVSLISNRDWVNQRSWSEKPGEEYIIWNHTVDYDHPLPKGCVRAHSYMTGYIVRPVKGGCSLSYLTQTDVKGWIPAKVSNYVTTKFAPKIIEKLTKACKGYTGWKSKHDPDNKPWRVAAKKTEKPADEKPEEPEDSVSDE